MLANDSLFAVRLIGPDVDDVLWLPSVPPAICMPVPVTPAFFASPRFQNCASVDERLMVYAQASSLLFINTGEHDACGFPVYRTAE